MTARQFHQWRERCGLSSWQAVADLLQVSPRTVERYARSGAPYTIALACEALEARHAQGLMAGMRRRQDQADDRAAE